MKKHDFFILKTMAATKAQIDTFKCTGMFASPFTCTIQQLAIQDNLIELRVICNMCGFLNRHSIDAETSESGELIINFRELGRRWCDNFACLSEEYELYPKFVT